MKFAVALILPFVTGGQLAPRSRVDGPLTLRQAIEIAQRASPVLQASLADVAAARAETRGARARRAPVVSANAFAAQSTNGAFVTGSPGVDPQIVMGVPARGFLDLNLMAMAPIFTAGVLEGRIAAATAREAAALADALETRGDVAVRAADAYLRAQFSVQLAAAEQARVEANRELVRTTRAQFEAGKGIEATVRRAEAELAQAERSLAAARNDVAKSLLDLKAAIGIDLESNVSLADPLTLAPAPGAVEPILEGALRRRGILIAARARARAAAEEVRAAEGARRPQIYGFAMGDLNPERSMSGGTIGLSLSLPITGAVQRAEIERAQAMRARAQAQVQDAELTTGREVRQAWLDVQTAAANAVSAEASGRAAAAAYEVVAMRVASGKAILVEQLDALQALTRARADLAQALYEQRIAVARLRRAAGEVPFLGDTP